MLEDLPRLVNDNAALVRRGRHFTGTFLVGIGDSDWLVEIEAGRVRAATEGPHLMRSWRFAIRASEEAWYGFWDPVPRPGYHDISALAKRGAATIEGDLAPLMANLRYVKEVLAALRAPPRPTPSTARSDAA